MPLGIARRKKFRNPHKSLCVTKVVGRGINSSQLTMMNQNPGERMGSDPIASEKVTIERKIFFLDLKENQRGRFLKITEDVGGRRDTIMLPAEAFRDFLEALQRLVEFESKL